MSTFGASRKQTPQNIVCKPEYLVLGSEPLPSAEPLGKLPRFTYANRYLTKRQVMRKLRRLKRSQPQ